MREFPDKGEILKSIILALVKYKFFQKNLQIICKELILTEVFVVAY